MEDKTPARIEQDPEVNQTPSAVSFGFMGFSQPTEGAVIIHESVSVKVKRTYQKGDIKEVHEEVREQKRVIEQRAPSSQDSRPAWFKSLLP
ncbi:MULTISPECIES: hypothetical protein [Helicobacter]|uniref:hypothetical protein n=1 Tax=Helicobacter TaxID=209 RepID=UPI000EB1B146|nr:MULTISPECIES: hypothetical protein [Helicobacter]